ncbi:recombinase family protein [Nocardiopsis sp. FR26]|uniref:recombinase family protein n=1 Tax=Nocardiopsis sp. FR26 TaxID=2605987 RepID=UPI001359BD6C|nr:recombinase family protein [Nocardiopsis sp. FR26]
MSQYGPPIDLTGVPGWAHTDLRPRRVAFAGRVSTKDNQDPRSSIPRQVALASERLQDGEQFVAHFYDVESGMLPPELRGLGTTEMYDTLAVPVPRDGGLQELLDQAEHRGITHVIAERSDRVARAMLTSLTVEHELEKLGVEVVYANEPVGGTKTGQLRTRRYSQVDAEVYRYALLEMSMGGQVQHTTNGWNHGRPPYPYIAVVDENAPPQPERFGPRRPKKKLAFHPDERRQVAAAELFRLRLKERMRGEDIAFFCNSRPDLYPVDGEWTIQRVEGLLANPKLTGYQVYNRKASRTGGGRINPISEWVWSPREVHPRIITIQEWAATQEVTANLKNRADGGISRVREPARTRGWGVRTVRSSDTHVMYRAGGHEFTVPRGPLPDELADRIIADVLEVG